MNDYDIQDIKTYYSKVNDLGCNSYIFANIFPLGSLPRIA